MVQNSGSITVNDGTHRRIQADEIEIVDDQVILTGNIVVTVDDTYGEAFDEWNEGAMKAWPPFADGPGDDDLVIKGDVTYVGEVGEGQVQYYVECFPSQEACLTIRGYGQ